MIQAMAVALVLATGERGWTTKDTVLEASMVALVAFDVGQTRWHLDNDGYERNPLLGRRPSAAKLYGYAAAGCAAHAAIAYLLPQPWRARWQAASLVLESANVVNNARTPTWGVRLSW